jgi:hypothetical protein
MVVISDGVFVDVRQGAFLGADAAGEVAEMVGSERNVSRQGFADRLAVVDGLGVGDGFQIGFDAIGDLEQDIGAGGRSGLAPGVGCCVGGIQGQFDVFSGGTGSLGIDLATDRGDDIEVLTLDRGNPLATDKVVVLGLVGNLGTSGAGAA